MSNSRCEWCGKEFERTHQRGPAPKYCTASHRQLAYHDRQRHGAAQAVVADAIRRLQADPTAGMREALAQLQADPTAGMREALAQLQADPTAGVREALAQLQADPTAGVREALAQLQVVSNPNWVDDVLRQIEERQEEEAGSTERPSVRSPLSQDVARLQRALLVSLVIGLYVTVGRVLLEAAVTGSIEAMRTTGLLLQVINELVSQHPALEGGMKAMDIVTAFCWLRSQATGRDDEGPPQ